VLVVLCEIPLVLQHFGLNSSAYGMAGGFVLASLAVLLMLRHLGQRKAEPSAATIATALGKARRLHDTCLEKSEAYHGQELERVKHEYQNTIQTIERQLKRALAEAGECGVVRMTSDERTVRITAKNEEFHRASWRGSSGNTRPASKG